MGPAIGVLVDRHDGKEIMIGADLIIAAAGAVLAIVAFCMGATCLDDYDSIVYP